MAAAFAGPHVVIRVHRWRELLGEGRYPCLRALAADLGVDNSYVARIPRFTLLAPGLIEATLSPTTPAIASSRVTYFARKGV